LYNGFGVGEAKTHSLNGEDNIMALSQADVINEKIKQTWFHIKQKLASLDFAFSFADNEYAKLHEQAHRAPTGLGYHEWQKRKEKRRVSSYKFLRTDEQRNLVLNFMKYVEAKLNTKNYTTKEEIIADFEEFELKGANFFIKTANPTVPTVSNTKVAFNSTTIAAMADYAKAGVKPEDAAKLMKAGVSAAWAKKFMSSMK
jgi:hypothetical protein